MHSRLELIKGTAILFISSNLLWVTLNPRNGCKVFWLQIKQKYWSDHIFVPKKVEGTFWHWSILCFVWFVAILFANKQLILAKNPNSINFALKVCLKDFLLLQEWVAISGEEVIIPTALSIPTIFENFRQEVGLNWLLSAFFLKFNNKIKVYVMSQ